MATFLGVRIFKKYECLYLSQPGHIAKYRKLLAMLIYVLRTSPDTAAATSLLSVRTAEFTDKDYEALRRVTAYLYQTVTIELVYSSGSEAQLANIGRLYARSDTAYLTHRDPKSHYEICFSYGNKRGMFFSKSGKQNCVLTSSTQAGRVMFNRGVCEVYHLLSRCSERARFSTDSFYSSIHRQRQSIDLCH